MTTGPLRISPVLRMMVALSCFLLSHVISGQGTLVVNGDFNSNANGWTLTNGSSSGSGYTLSGDQGGCFILDNIAPSDSTDPTGSQTIDGLVPGTVYVVSGKYAGGKDRGADSLSVSNFAVEMEGVVLFEAVVPAISSWQSFAFLYSATSPSATLRLSSQRNGSGVSCLFDDIAVQPLPTLEVGVASGNIVLSWHTNIFGFTLQSSANVSDGMGWSDVSNEVVIVESNYTVTLEATDARRFFRLKL